MNETGFGISWPGWETVKIIGRGSFGAVYEIRREVFGAEEKAALKVISVPQDESELEDLYSDGYDEESITATFQEHLKSIVSEYTLMRKLNGCANIVNCEDIRYVQHDRGIGWDIFIKMELLTPLAKSLTAPVKDETVLKMAMDLCAALELCEKYKIIHRDIKPQNIFVSVHGDYKLGDFGIAKTVEKTVGGTKIGTYKFMAPEVYLSQPYGHAADIYSLGLVLYWMLNERRMPFVPLPPTTPRHDEEENARHRRFSGEQLPPPAHGSEELKKIVLKACAFDPKERYHTAAELREALETLRSPQSGKASRVFAAPAAQSRQEPEEKPAETQKEPPVPPIRIRFLQQDQVLSSREYTKGDPVVPPDAEQEIEQDGSRWRFSGWEPEVPQKAEKSADYQAVYEEITLREETPPEERAPETTGKRGWWLFVILIALIATGLAFFGRSLTKHKDNDPQSIEVNDYDNAEQELERQYAQAEELFKAGKYTKAEQAFTELGDYKDSAVRVLEVKYALAEAMVSAGNYKQAEKAFTDLGDYSDAAERAQESLNASVEELTGVDTANLQILISGTWDHGDAVVALDDNTLWGRITDDRPDAQYNDLGTPWDIELNLGEEMRLENSVGGYAVNYPFRIYIESLAGSEMYYAAFGERNNNLSISQNTHNNQHWVTVNKVRANVEIEKDGNTYSFIVSLPEWFDLSVAQDPAVLDVSLMSTDFYSLLSEHGSAAYDEHYEFFPQ